jgi:hypothetical protein
VCEETQRKYWREQDWRVRRQGDSIQGGGGGPGKECFRLVKIPEGLADDLLEKWELGEGRLLELQVASERGIGTFRG